MALAAVGCLWASGEDAAESTGAREEGAALEEVLVTGSRIRRDALDARDTLLALAATERERTGMTALGDLLARLPIAGSPLSTRFNSSGNFGFPADGGGIAAGASQVDLRHLGAKRVLVLVDGLRWVHGTSASGVPGATDLNTIPASAIERLEVLRDGASAIYGSDAIAGVVNVITRRPRGVSASVQAGAFVNGGETTDIALSAGGSRGASSGSLHIAHTDQRRVSAADHWQTREPKPGTGVTHGSTFTPQGRIVAPDPNTGGFINCALREGVSGMPRYDASNPCGPNDDYHPWSNADRFNYATYNLVLTPSKRTGAMARLTQGLGQRTRLDLRAVVNRRLSVNQAAPEPLWAGTLAETGSLMDRTVIAADNAYNPFGFDLGPGGFITRRPIESGPRVFRQDVRTRYAAATLQGEWSVRSRPLYWDLNAVWSRNVAEQTKHGAHNARRMFEALGPATACGAIPGCVPLNLLGGQGAAGAGTITRAMLDWIGFVQRDSSDQSLRSLTFNVTGDLVSLPAGELAFATGIERREQDGRFDPDPVVAAGDSAGLPAAATAGGYDVSEWYGELEVPIVAGAAWADLLDVSGAVRGFDYSTFNSGATGRAGLRWRPVPEVLIRATWAEGFRAPNIGELFGGLTRLDAAISDPCAGFLTTNVGATVVANCIAGGVPADGSYSQFGGQISVLTGGNAGLEPETSNGRTLTLTWQPTLDGRFVEDLRFEVTRYQHDVDDAITGFDAQAVLDGCYRDGVGIFCDLIERNPRGGIARFRNTLFNVGSVHTAGWDIGAAATVAANWRLRWDTTRLSDFTERLMDTAGRVVETRELAGETHADRGKPAWKSGLSVEWRRGAWTATWGARYIDGITERCSDFLDGTPDSLTAHGLCAMPDIRDNTASRNRLASTTYHDVYVGWRKPGQGAGLNLSLGVSNVFDRDPPVSQSASLNGYDASVYDIPGGRFVYLRLSWSMATDQGG